VADRLTPQAIIALLEATLDAAYDGIIAVDLNARLLFHNRRYLEMFGYTDDQLRRGGVPFIVEDLSDRVVNYDALLSNFDRMRALPRGRSIETLRFRDGRVFERSIAPCRVNGEAVGLVASYRELTEPSRYESAFEREHVLLEEAQQVAQVGSWVLELDGSDRLEWSRQTHTIFGVVEGEFAGTRRAFLELVHPADREAVRKASAAAAEAGGRAYDLEHRIVRPDGAIRWVHEKARVMFNDEGRPIRMIGAVQDITERRMLEDQLRQAQKMEAIGRLAGGIAHDLNNALTAIAGYAELALGAIEPDHPARPDVHEIRRGAERAGSVTRQLLAFSRKELLEPRLFDLNQTIASIGRLLGRLLGTDIQVRTELRPVPPILGDPGQVEQAVINLAVNARDAMPNGGRLSLATSVETLDEAAARANAPMPAGRYVVLRVSDTGHGMAPETQARIFEPFFTTKDPGKGTGLGLSMVYGTLKQIGGFIFVDSELGRGTTFRLYFRPASSRSPAAANPPPHGGVVDTRGGVQTILVVEDEPAVRNLVASALRADDYRLLLAGSAEEALRLTESSSEHIDLLLTDAIMPGRSGIELADLLLSKRPGLRVIVMSGYTEENLEGLDGRVELLQKPFAPRELRRRIREALSHARESSS
jgi:two-component system cell cycle sensor histidine kinase/response regulator CckA